MVTAQQTSGSFICYAPRMPLFCSEAPPLFFFCCLVTLQANNLLSDSLPISDIFSGDSWLNSLVCVNHVLHNVAFIQGHSIILRELVEQYGDFHRLRM